MAPGLRPSWSTPEAYSSNKTVEAATETAKEQAIDAYESEIGDRAAIRRFVIQVLTTPAFKPIETSVSVALPEAGADDSTVTVTVS